MNSYCFVQWFKCKPYKIMSYFHKILSENKLFSMLISSEMILFYLKLILSHQIWPVSNNPLHKISIHCDFHILLKYFIYCIPFKYVRYAGGPFTLSCSKDLSSFNSLCDMIVLWRQNLISLLLNSLQVSYPVFDVFLDQVSPLYFSKRLTRLNTTLTIKLTLSNSSHWHLFLYGWKIVRKRSGTYLSTLWDHCRVLTGNKQK